MAVRYVLLGGESPGLGMLAPHVSNNYFGGILGRSSLRLQLGTQGGEQRAAEQQRAPQSFKSASCLSRMISSPTTTRERERLQGGIGAARHERGRPRGTNSDLAWRRCRFFSLHRREVRLDVSHEVWQVDQLRMLCESEARERRVGGRAQYLGNDVKER